jgi:DNA-binding SARP family transcriptional activator
MSLLVKVIKKYLSLIEELKLKTSIDSLRLLINRLTKLDSFDEKLSEKLSLIYIERIINLAD